MTTSSRASQFEKLFKVLRKHYNPVFPDANLPVLEHLLRACCLENAGYQAAETALAALFHEFFDLNEIRVSTVRELAEVMACLPDPAAAAQRIKRILQHIFEATYSFSLEELRKGTLGSAVERLQKIDGVSPFAVAYVVQSALGGHSIPIDSGTMEVLKILDLVSERDIAAWVVPGLERAIPKHQGIEFGSLLHQLGADFTANPYSPTVRAILLAIYPEAKERLPKRRSSAAASTAPSAEKKPEPPTVTAGSATDPGEALGQAAPKGTSKQAAEKSQKTRGRKKSVQPKADSTQATPTPAEAETNTEAKSQTPLDGLAGGNLAASEAPAQSPTEVPSQNQVPSHPPPDQEPKNSQQVSKGTSSSTKLSKKKPR